jgi:hypothetical protein
VTRKLNNRRSRERSLWLTRYLTQCHAVKLVKNFFGVKDIKEARQRLDRLGQEEVAITTAQILGGVDRLVQEDVATTTSQIVRGVDRLVQEDVATTTAQILGGVDHRQEDVATTTAQILGGVDLLVQEDVVTTTAQIVRGVDRLVQEDVVTTTAQIVRGVDHRQEDNSAWGDGAVHNTFRRTARVASRATFDCKEVRISGKKETKNG